MHFRINVTLTPAWMRPKEFDHIIIFFIYIFMLLFIMTNMFLWNTVWQLNIFKFRGPNWAVCDFLVFLLRLNTANLFVKVKLSHSFPDKMTVMLHDQDSCQYILLDFIHIFIIIKYVLLYPKRLIKSFFQLQANQVHSLIFGPVV